MRAIVFLCLVLPMLAVPPAALASDFDLDELDQKLSLALQRQIDQSLLAAVASRIEPQQAPESIVPANEPGRSRMTCRVSTANALECVVVGRRPQAKRIAQLP